MKSEDSDALVAQTLESAMRARLHAHAPYSHYQVGAAILTRSGSIFAGCNVENASFGATLCAERTAIASMVAAGERDPIFCVVVTAGERPASPCGICRQVLAEFAKDLPILCIGVTSKGFVREKTSLTALLPKSFHFQAPAKKKARKRAT